MDTMLTLIRKDARDDGVDMWVQDRIELGIKTAARLVACGAFDQAILKLESIVKLLEETMTITNDVILNTSCRFLAGMEWHAKEDWHSENNNPDAPKERMIFVYTETDEVTSCYCIYPSEALNALNGKAFDPLRTDPKFKNIYERVKALIVTE